MTFIKTGHRMTISLSKRLQLFALSAILLAFTPISHADQLIDRIAAVVNDQIILQSELQQKTIEAAQELRAKQIPINNPAELQAQVLDNLIMELLQKERAAQLGLSVSDDEINQRLLEIANQNNMTLPELRDRLNSDMSNGFMKFRTKLQTQLLIQKVREQEIISRTIVTDDEINNYLQRNRLDNSSTEYHLRHILVTLPESATQADRDAALKEINEIAARIRSGEDFSQMAVRYSKSSQALSGGDLGWLKQEQIPTFFDKALKALQPGQVSDVISSPSGFHLIKLEGVRDSQRQMITQYHLHRFLILDDSARQSRIPLEIRQLVQQIDSLEAFNALKDRYADIPAEVNANMDQGWKVAEELPPALQRELNQLQPNQMATPIATEKGWVLYFTEALRQVDANENSERQQAIQAIRIRKANETFEIWLRRLRDEAFVDIRI